MPRPPAVDPFDLAIDVIDPVYIYALADPRTLAVRYVGKTIRNPVVRLREHIDYARSSKPKYHIHKWLAPLLAEGYRPIMEILEVASSEDWVEAEKWWIASISREEKLTNHTDGGEGHSGHRPSEETRKKLSAWQMGRVLTPEHRAKLSAAHKGVPLAASHKEAIGESLRNSAKSNKGRTFSEAWRKNLSESHKGKRKAANA